MTSKEIRRQFIDFFRAKGHAFVESSPVVPLDDPTLMFTNAGMNQFKPIFLGSQRATHPRVANSQKCIRAGGKHNDLDDVGQDTYHHTFFEMLGNWSFGDYFKKEAIEWAWELLTKVWGIDQSRLHATYFGGLHRPTAGIPNAGGHRADDEDRRSKIEDRKDSASIVNRQSEIDNRQFQWELEPDYEARDLWASVTDIDPAHIHPGNMKDNFWEMGDTGPCGPCSEIHIDLTPDGSGGPLVNKGDARVIEIWNLVFIQFNRGGDGKLTPLPQRHVDTGMGFERICAVIQGMRANRLGSFSNYDTDVFTPIFDAIRKRTGATKYTGLLPNADRQLPIAVGADSPSIDNQKSTIDNAQLLVDVSYRVIADHLRCLAFALTDGAIPSNEGRGYVLRRILRRAVRYGRQYMNMHEPFLCDLVSTVVEHMCEVFPELRGAHRGKNVEHVANLIREEETSFLKTLDRGIKLFNEAAQRAPKTSVISGEDAFKLHDTYGFPIDLTQLMAQEQGLTVHFAEYERLMEEARERARSLHAFVDDDWEHARTRIASATVEERQMLHLTIGTQFSGYDELESSATVVATVWDRSGKLRANIGQEIKEGERGAIWLDKSPFYVERGGQVGDKGEIVQGNGIFRVDLVESNSDLARPITPHSKDSSIHEVIVHYGMVLRGTLRPDSSCIARVDIRRISIMQNHTATHVLNWALREVLEIEGGGKVDQKGSLVDADKTRFDFSHGKPLSKDEIQRIEELCQAQIDAALPVYAAVREEDYIDQTEARKIKSLRAVFGEKYPERVRVVSIGAPITEKDARQTGADDWLLKSPDSDDWMSYSVEFCGGTHVKNTKEIECFVLTHEEGVAKGVRRVVGIIGQKARTAVSKGTELHNKLTDIERLATKELIPAVNEFEKFLTAAEIPLQARHELRIRLADVHAFIKKKEKEQTGASANAALDAVRALLDGAQTVGGVTVVVGEVPGADADALRGGIDYVRTKKGSSAVLLATASDGKVTLVAGMSRDVAERGVKAGDLIKEICPLVGGKGGGRPDMAQGGGTEPGAIEKALDAARAWIADKLGG